MTNTIRQSSIVETLSADQPITAPALKRGHVLAAGGNVQKDTDSTWSVLSNGKKYIVLMDTQWRCSCEQGQHYGVTANMMGVPAPHFCKHIAAVVIAETLGLELSKPQSIFEMVIGIVANQAIYASPTEIYVKTTKQPDGKKTKKITNLVQDDDLLRLKSGKVVSEPIAKQVQGRWQMVFDSSVNYEMWVKEIKG